ncbi:T9SS type A sorting domain-containing protein [Cryomorpha ignava]|uniref:T9SS type A sorting domain-containing protein n=1 Tax=Cryomorpha ignava TaxID=101383 RepID=A0A7K3WTD4_9FLAO|nr:T9SS type A sorting domain-containing protein [Cryomorpha ignava]NEN24953.1 T9SS type A sorting domain-containing protein [Cryomorpha ignava]
MKKLTGFLILFSLFFVQTGYSQFCNDPEAWNYSPSGDTDTSCVYLLDCGENEVNRLFQLFPMPNLHGANIYMVSLNELDTLAHMVANVQQNLPWDINTMVACMHVDSCYYIDVYPTQPDSGGVHFSWLYPDTLAYQGGYGAIPGTSNPYRLLVGAEQNTCGVIGCTDSTAINYSPSATINAGCEYCEDNAVFLTPNFVFNNQSISWQIQQNGESVAGDVLGTSMYNNFDLACLPDGCYELVLDGDAWLFSTITLHLNNDTILTAGLTHDGEVRVPFGINSEPCLDSAEIYGCTNPLGQNYNPQATIDDGTCDLQNEECNLGIEMYQDSITGAIHFDIDIYSTDYPIDIFWDFGDGSPISSEWWTQHTYDSIGTYQVCATLYAQQFFEQEPLCYDETCITITPDDFGLNGSGLIIFNGDDTGIKTISNVSELSLSPNPVRDIIRLTLPQNQSLKKIKVYSLDGRLVMGVPDLQSNNQQGELNVSQLASGSYILRAEGTGGNLYSGRFVKL